MAPPNFEDQLTDEGWSHVSSKKNRRQPQKSSSASITSRPNPSIHEALSPASAPDGLTLSKLQQQYSRHRTTFEESKTWVHLHEYLRQRSRFGTLPHVTKCVCIGLGSPSGFSRGGTVDRRTQSMYQLAALDCLLVFLNEQSNSGKIQAFAQDPVFNTLDIALLQSLDIEVLATPTAFNEVDSDTVLFAPGAEKSHLSLVLPSKPPIVFGGPLEESQQQQWSVDVGVDIESARLAPFEACESAFWMMRLFIVAPGE